MVSPLIECRSWTTIRRRSSYDFVYLPESGRSPQVIGMLAILRIWCESHGPPMGHRPRDADLSAVDRCRGVVEDMIGRSLDAQVEGQRRWKAEVRAQAIL